MSKLIAMRHNTHATINIITINITHSAILLNKKKTQRNIFKSKHKKLEPISTLNSDANFEISLLRYLDG